MEKIFHSSSHGQILPDLFDLFGLGDRKRYALNRNPKLGLPENWTPWYYSMIAVSIGKSRALW